MQYLIASHIFLIALSNVLVQVPFVLFGFNTTWGAFTYPLIFILTDLTVRIAGPHLAKRVIYFSMLPGLLISYGFASTLVHHAGESVSWWQQVPIRVALASLTAYAVGQLLDVTIFSRLRQNSQWWLAPSVSSLFGNIFDTFLFFFVAFYQSIDPFMNANWFEIAYVDLFFKLIISGFIFVPVYGLVLNSLFNKKGVSQEKLTP